MDYYKHGQGMCPYSKILFQFTIKTSINHIEIKYINSLIFKLGTFHEKVLENTPWEQAGMKYSIMALHTRYNR